MTASSYSIAYSSFILFGILVSYIPQHYKIVSLKSSEGISLHFVILGGLTVFPNIAAVIILNLPDLLISEDPFELANSCLNILQIIYSFLSIFKP
ncbi:hypothetical protein ROZALSC1DRAFT_29297 [Rozella allomycis CSF55]|uniref:Uncharacterized protein n=1 Tax=Rozella allomycis (strain CSF55) TaxID=988480 RepID=A0A075AVY5_ROZAC|nr:hypothetical protein O9G_000612 [Rozella allomycis CSF55]RKP19077.1 hypothetical protein ROZALSC1DRAFT_29297 [Rozella allomycis CSF55]|eukprot:EPZ34425.1 hypothetical protein O9G_000612 [Rozella allomycis CSF55]